MWSKILTIALSAFSGWFASDVYNEYQTTRQVQTALPEAAKKNWLKWLVIGVGGAVIFALLSRAIKILFPKINLLPKK